MTNAELSKEIKKPPEIEYAIPKTIFMKPEAVSEQGRNLMVKLFDSA